ncbi:MAG TPA: hypothetical protein VGM65_07750 [Candidatus Udaeobacter sp.]|jgi:hypothetical protein
MNSKNLDKHTLYFEVLVNPETGEAPRLAKAVSLLDASSSCVTAICPDYPDAPSGRTITFDHNDIAQFVRNDSKRMFEIAGRSYTPEFIYIQKQPIT